MSFGISFFAGSQVSSPKKMDEKSRFDELSTEEIQEIMDNAASVTTKRPQSSRLDYLTVPLKVTKLKYDRRDFMHSWRLRNKNNVYPNRMAYSSWWHQIFHIDIRNVKRRTECLFEVLLHFCEEERWHVLQNFIHEIQKSRHWSFPSHAAAQQTVFHYLWPGKWIIWAFVKDLRKTGIIASGKQVSLLICNEQMRKLFDLSELGSVESKNPAQLQRTT